MGRSSDKVTNLMFVWGQSDSTQSDLAVVTPDQNYHTVKGAQGGELIYSDSLNSGLRAGTLVAYSLIEALRQGPAGVDANGNVQNQSSPTMTAGTKWDNALPSGIAFNYAIVDSAISASFVATLSQVLQSYIQGSSVWHADKASALYPGFTFTLNGLSPLTNRSKTTSTVSIDGTGAITLTMPDTIKVYNEGETANVSGEIGGMPLDSIFYDADTYPDGSFFLDSGVVKEARRALIAPYTPLSPEPSAANKKLPIPFRTDADSSAWLYASFAKSPYLSYDPYTKEIHPTGLNAPVQRGNYAEAVYDDSQNVNVVNFDEGVPALLHGMMILVRFDTGNIDATQSYLQIGTGASVSVYDEGKELAAWRAGDIVQLIYNANASSDYPAGWHTVHPFAAPAAIGYCSTAAGTQTKTVSVPGFRLEENATLFVKFSNANSASNPKLSVNGGTAYPIYYLGSAASSTSGDYYRGWYANEFVELFFDGARFNIANKPFGVPVAQDADSAVHADTADEASTATYAQRSGYGNHLTVYDDDDQATQGDVSAYKIEETVTKVGDTTTTVRFTHTFTTHERFVGYSVTSLKVNGQTYSGSYNESVTLTGYPETLTITRDAQDWAGKTVEMTVVYTHLIMDM